MSAQLIGAHMPTGKGLGDALRRGKAIGCTAVQIFTKSPQLWRAKAITDDMVADFRAAQAETGITEVIAHDSYLINLCSSNPEVESKSRVGLADELRRCHQYGVKYLVSHIGALTGREEAEALSLAANTTRETLDDTPDDVMLLAETTAGQGSCLNASFTQLGAFLRAVDRPNRLGVCLDTCHVFAAGYDLRTAETYTATWEAFEREVGLEHLKVIHVNDSKMPFGSRKDRHAHLGQGEIGEVGFRLLVKDPRFARIPLIVETPEAETHHAENVARLWEWAR